MKKIILNGKLMENNPHEYMKKSLNFPEYYGKNLDALFDCLSEIGEKTEITLIYSKKIKKTRKKYAILFKNLSHSFAMKVSGMAH